MPSKKEKGKWTKNVNGIKDTHASEAREMVRIKNDR